MFETNTASDGVGLAAPQIGKSIRVVIIDLDVLKEDFPEYEGFRHAFINAHIVEYDEESKKETMEEGCLSIPGLHERVTRPHAYPRALPRRGAPGARRVGGGLFGPRHAARVRPPGGQDVCRPRVSAPQEPDHEQAARDGQGQVQLPLSHEGCPQIIVFLSPMRRWMTAVLWLAAALPLSAQYNVKRLMEEGRRQLDMGYYVVAMQVFERIAAMKPHQYEAWYLSALCKYSTGRLQREPPRTAAAPWPCSPTSPTSSTSTPWPPCAWSATTVPPSTTRGRWR